MVLCAETIFKAAGACFAAAVGSDNIFELCNIFLDKRRDSPEKSW